MFDRLTSLDLEFSVVALAHGPEPLYLFLLAVALDALIGPVLRRLVPLPHPDRIIAAVTLAMERRLNREQRSPATRLIRGLILVLFLLMAGGAFAAAAWAAAALLPFGWVLALIILLAFITQHRPFGAARGAARRMTAPRRAGGLELAAREPVLSARRLSGASSTDPHAVARGAIEHLAGRYGEGLIAESFWFVLLGLPGLILYRVINVMGAVLDESLPRREEFGLVSTRLNEAVTFLPVRLAALLLTLAAFFVAGAKPLRAFATMAATGWRRTSRGIAWPVAAAAGALDLSLSGPPLAAKAAERSWRWIGPAGGRARATQNDVRRGLFLYAVACLLNIVALLLVAIATSSF